MSVVRVCRGGPSRCLVVAVAVVLSAACSKGVSEAQRASAALTAGLKAHAAGRLVDAAADYRTTLIYDEKGRAELAIAAEVDPSLAGRIPIDLLASPAPPPRGSAERQAFDATSPP